jgi:hypothetical protein
LSNYHMKNLKCMMNDFLAMIKWTMGIHRVMLIGYKRADAMVTTM